MANTRYLTTEVEDFVRAHLALTHGVRFQKRFLMLKTGGMHEFDAVSEDDAIVASIKATSGKTAGGNLPQGKFNNAIAEIYYLSLVSAEVKLLVLTNPSFRALLERRMAGALPPEIKIDVVILPAVMQQKVDEVLSRASKEVSPSDIETVIEAEAEVT